MTELVRLMEFPRDLTSWGWGRGSTAGFSALSTTRYPSGSTSWKYFLRISVRDSPINQKLMEVRRLDMLPFVMARCDNKCVR
jgi:hypothetical protein